MWLRQDLKMRGNTAFRRNYWSVVAVTFIITIAAGMVGSGAGATRSVWNGGYNGYNNAGHGGIGTVLFAVVFSLIFLVFGLIILLLRIFIGNLLLVGGNRFFMENRERSTGISTVLYAFKSKRYGNVVLTMFLRDLFILLWTLLFIVPGFVKSYEYAMVAYILSENPNMDRKRAFALSKQMMHGQKMDAFLLDLSFIGWALLSCITCGIVGVFYAKPYQQATWAELYAVLRVHGLQNGLLTTNDLPGYGEVYS